MDEKKGVILCKLPFHSQYEKIDSANIAKQTKLSTLFVKI